jgi:preprotein translocase subunit Sss1
MNYIETLKNSYNLAISTYRKLRKPNLIDIEKLYKQLMFALILLGSVGILVTVISYLIDLIFLWK